MKTKSLIAGIILASSSTVALADQFYIDAGQNFGDNARNKAAGGTTTGWLDQAAFNYQSNSLVTDHDLNGLDAGDSIVTAGGFTDLASVGFNAIDGFLPNNFGTESANGYGAGNWGLTFQFDLSGTLDAALAPVYNTGDITFYAFNSGDAVAAFVELFTLDFISMFNTAGGPSLRTIVSSVGAGTFNGVAAGDVFNFADGSMTDLMDDMVDVFSFVDFNTDPRETTVTDNNDGTFTLTGNHDGSMSFQIPEPSSLAILGLGLLGFAGAARRRKN